MKTLERQAAMKDRQFSIKWTTSRRSSKELVISGPLELGQISRRDVGPQIARDHMSGSARRDPRKVSEGPRSRSLDTRASDAVVQQRHVNSQISRDAPALSESRRRSGDNIPNGEGNELFKKEFIEKLSERAKQREPEAAIPDDFVRPEHFVKPVKIHSRHGRSESGDLIQVIGSPKRDSFERVRVIELPRTPRSPLHEKSKSPFTDKLKDPEWIAKCEKLNVDHPDHHDQHHHRRTFSGADSDAETSRDFMLSKFFDNPASKASPREMYDVLSNEEQDQLSTDLLGNHQSLRRMASRKSLFVEGEILQRGKPLGKILAGDDPPRSSTSSATSGSRITSPDLNADKDSPAAILRQSLARAPSRRMSFIDPRIRRAQEELKAAGQAIQVDYNTEEAIRMKEAMLKSLRAAAAVDQAHFLRTLQDQGAVQSSSPLRPNGEIPCARSPSRGSDTSSFMRSPMTPTITKSPSSAKSENVRGNSVEGSVGGDFLARASPGETSSPSQDRWEEPKRVVDISNSTIASRVAARRRRSLSQESLTTLDREGRKIEPLPQPSAETVPKAEESPQNSSSGPSNSGGKSTVLQKIEKSRERRRRRAEKESAQSPPVLSGSTQEQQPAGEKINNAASKSWNIAASYIFGGKSSDGDDVEEEVKGEVNENVKESIIQKLMKRASARQANSLARQDSGEARDLQQKREEVSQSSATKQQFTSESSVPVAEGSQHSSSETPGPNSTPGPEVVRSSSRGTTTLHNQRSSNGNRAVSPVPSPKSEDAGNSMQKSPLSSIESSSNAEDMSGLLADLTGSVGLALGNSPSREALDSSLRVNVRTSPGQPQPSPESKLEAKESETVVQTPERTQSAASGPCWSPGSDDSGSDGSSLDNQPSPVSVLNNSRTPFAEDKKLVSIESKINLLDQKLQESHDRSQKLTAASVLLRKDGAGRIETAHAPVELINQEVKIVELNPEGAPLRKSSKPGKAAPAKCDAAKSVPCPPHERYVGGHAATGYEHRRSREVAHRHAPGAAVGSRGGHCEQQATDFRKSLEIIAGSASDFRKSLEIFDLENIPTRGRRKWDLVYARDVLVASGFGRDVPSGPMTKWHSVSEPIDPSLFEKMEDYYKTAQKFLGCERLRRLAFYQPDHLRLADRIKASVNTKQGRFEPMHRCHLFDVVNELLAKKLGPYRNPRNPWLKSPMMRPRPTGKMLLEEIWRDITDQIGRNGSIHYDQKLLHLQLENMIGEDLYKRSHWFPSPDFDTFVERIVGELEKRIFHDLVLETVATLQSI